MPYEKGNSSDLADWLCERVLAQFRIGDPAAVEKLAHLACHTFAGWDPEDTAEGDVIDAGIDEAIKRLQLDSHSVWKLIGISDFH